MHSVLIVEDDPSIAELLEYNLEREGMHVKISKNGEEAQNLLHQKPFDVVLLDLMLPGCSGFDLCRKIRENEKTKNLFIMMVTAKNSESDIIAGLELGADDYITKPFSPREVVARINAVLRRSQKQTVPTSKDFIRFRELIMDLKRHQVLSRGKNMNVTATEFKILQQLMVELGRVLTRRTLIAAVFGENISITERTIDVHITNLRKKIEPSGTKTKRIPTLGHRIKDEQ